MSNAQRSRPTLIATVAFAALLASCQTATPSPSPSAYPSPSQSAQPPSSAEVITAFLDLVDDPGFTMHVVLHGSVDVTEGGTTDDAGLSFDMDISGTDAHGQMTVDTGPGDITIEMLLVDYHAYVDDNGTWTELPDYEQTAPLNPFANLFSPDDVTYSGFEDRSGGRANHLVSRIWLGGDVGALTHQGWADPVVDGSYTDIWVWDDGTPLQMDFDGRVSGTYLDEVATARFVMSYLCTNVGEPVEIPSPFKPA